MGSNDKLNRELEIIERSIERLRNLQIPINRIDQLKDIIKMRYHKDGSSVVENLNVARTAWIRAGLGGGEFTKWKPNGIDPPDVVLKQLSDTEREELFDVIQSCQFMGEEDPSSSD